MQGWEVKVGGDGVASKSSHDEEDNSEDELVVAVDPAEAHAKECEVHVYQVHVVYSMTYQVPVLYFLGQAKSMYAMVVNLTC